MIGDKLVITDYHRAAAAKVLPAVRRHLATKRRPIAVTIAGESGCGKTETAYCLRLALEQEGMTCLVLAQDDYFWLPPQSNHRKRESDISWVGTGEVQLDLLESHIDALKLRPDQPLSKPQVDFAANRVESELVGGETLDVIIIEGTYTTLLANVDIRAFINRNYHQTKKARLTRARDPSLGFIERVLEIEHQEISKHKARADVVIDPPEGED